MKTIYKGHNFVIQWSIMDAVTSLPFDFNDMFVEFIVYSDNYKGRISGCKISGNKMQAEIMANTLPVGVYDIVCSYKNSMNSGHCICRRAFNITRNPEFCSNTDRVVIESYASPLKLENMDINYLGHFPSEEVLPDSDKPAWALVGTLKFARPWFFYTANVVPPGCQTGWNDLSEVLGTYDLTVDKVSIFDFNLVTEYNVSRNHPNIKRDFSNDWGMAKGYYPEYDEYQPYKVYQKGDYVNMPEYTENTFIALCETSDAPFVVTSSSNEFTLEEALAVVPEDYKYPGIKITFANSQTKKAETYYWLGGDWSSTERWIIPNGDNGLPPRIANINNRLYYSYDGKNWEVCSEEIAAYFRFKSTYDESNGATIGNIQISRDNKNWQNLSPEFVNHLRISAYVSTKGELPTNNPVGTMYGVGPTYKDEDTARANPIYRIYVYDGTTWVDNGSFTSIKAGIVQETGNNENVVMSQKAVSEKLSELTYKVGLKPTLEIGAISNGVEVDSDTLVRPTNFLGRFKIKLADGYLINYLTFYHLDGSLDYAVKEDLQELTTTRKDRKFRFTIRKTDNSAFTTSELDSIIVEWSSGIPADTDEKILEVKDELLELSTKTKDDTEQLAMNGSDFSRGIYANQESRLSDFLSLGGFYNGGKTDSKNRARFNGYLTAPFEIETNEGYIIKQITIFKNSGGRIVYHNQVGKNLNKYSVNDKDDYLYAIAFSKTEDTEVLSDSDLPLIVKSFRGNFSYIEEIINQSVKDVDYLKSINNGNMIDELYLELGGIDLSTGELVKSNTRCRIIGLLEPPFEIVTNDGYLILNVQKYDKKTRKIIDFINPRADKYIAEKDDYLYKVVFYKPDDESFDESELTSVISYFKNKNTIITDELSKNVDEINGALMENLTETTAKKSEIGYFIAKESGSYTITPITSWETWIIDAKGFMSLTASLGRSTDIQLNIVYLKDKDVTVDNIIGYEKSPSTGTVTYNIDALPDGCTYILLSNRTATVANPTFLLKRYANFSSIAEDVRNVEKGLKETDEKINGLSDDVIIPNVYITRERITKYSTYALLIAAWDELVASYPNLITKNELGTASDGQMLYEYVISSGNYNKEGLRGKDAEIEKPLVLLEAGIHGYEPASNTSLYIFAKDLVEGNLSLSKIRNTCDFKIIPCLNPYGYDNYKRGNANNVDLNRNFDADWVLQGDSSANPSYYGGASAASEPETKIMQNWLRSNIKAVMYIDFHNSSYNNEISCFGGSDELVGMASLKKSYLVGIHKLSSYLTSKLNIPDSSVWGYTFTNNHLNGCSSKYARDIGLIGVTLETPENVNDDGTNSAMTIAVGADVLGTILMSCVDLG